MSLWDSRWGILGNRTSLRLAQARTRAAGQPLWMDIPPLAAPITRIRVPALELRVQAGAPS